MAKSRDWLLNATELRKLCRSFITAAFEHLEVEGRWPRHAGAGDLQRRDFNRETLRSLPAFRALARFLTHDPQLRELYFRGDDIREDRFLEPSWRLLQSVARENRSAKLEAPVFDRWFRRFRRELYAASGRWRSFATITGLEVKSRPFNLNDHTALINHPGWALSYLADGQPIDFYGAVSPGGLDKATLITDFRVAKSEHHWDDHPPHHLTDTFSPEQAIVSAMRIYKGGAPRIHCHAMVHRSSFPLVEALGWGEGDGVLGFYEDVVVVTPEDHHSIRRIARYLIDNHYSQNFPFGRERTSMGVALSRFNETFRSQGWDDTFLSLAISLEALLGDREGEYRYRLASRAAWLLGVDDDASLEIYRQVRALYDIRSRVAHGSAHDWRELRNLLTRLSGRPFDVNEDEGSYLHAAIQAGRDIVRRALLACINLRMASVENGPAWPLQDDFDNLMWARSSRVSWQRAARVR